MISEETRLGFSTRAGYDEISRRALVDVPREENRRLREELRRSEEAQHNLNGLLDSAPDAVVVVNEKGRISMVNAQTERLFGYTRDQLLEKHIEILIPLRFREKHREHMTSYFSDPQLRPMGRGLELWACRRDGSEFPVEISISPIMTKDGLLVSSIIRDISRRKRGEEALRQSEAKFRNIVEASPLGMHLYQLETDGRLILSGANPAADEILGIEHEQLLGNTIETAFPNIAATEIPKQFFHVAASGESLYKDHLVYEDDRISGAYEVHAFQTAPFTMVSAFRNITARVQMQEAVKRLLYVSQAMLSTLDMDEVVEQVMQSLLEVLPYEMCSIYLLDKEAALLHPSRIVGQGYISETLADWSIPLGEAIIGAVAQSGEGELINNAHLDPRAVYPYTSHIHREHLISIPVMVHEEVIGVLNVGRTKAGPFKDEEFELVQLFTAQAAIAIHNAQLYSAADQQRKWLRILSRRLANAQEEERKDLARELHDRVGQNLTAMDFNLNMIGMLIPVDSPLSDQVRRQLDSASDLLTKTAKRIRHVMADLRPPVIDDYGLQAALEWHAKQIMEQRDIKITVSGEPDFRLNREEELAMFRIAQEAITNTLKYAEAMAVEISLETDPQRKTACLIIADDGQGFEMQQRLGPDERQSWGLIGMVERAEAVGAVCCIHSAPGEGTQVVVEVSR